MKWLNNIFRKAKQLPAREVELVEVFTFQTGEKLYTYNFADLGKINSRHYRGLQEARNALEFWGMSQKRWEASLDEVIKCSEMHSKKEITDDEYNTQVRRWADYFKTAKRELKSADETVLEYLFCMFFVLDEEKELGYDEVNNKKKLKLLYENPAVADFFLSKADEIGQASQLFLKKDLPDYLTDLIHFQKIHLDMLKTSTDLK